ncbi:MAG: glycosyltransferase family 39 protein [Verrucomicrobiota bacterium]
MVAAVFCCFVSVLLFVQAATGVPWKKTVELEVDKPNEVGGRILIPKKWRGSEYLQTAVLLEDGKALPYRMKSVRRVVESDGGGRYRIRDKYIYFTSSDRTSPVDNERQYTLRIGVEPKDGILFGVFGLALITMWLATRGKRKEKRMEMRDWLPAPGIVAWSLFSVTVVIGGWFLWSGNGGSDGFQVVNGIPYSDSLGWCETAVNMKEGNGFQGAFRGHRPLYAIFLASAFSVFGDHLMVAKWSSVFLWASTVGFAWLLGQKLAGSIGGLALALWFLLNPEFGFAVHRPLTETLAMALMVPALYVLVVGIERHQLRWLFFGGLLLALSNLSRPFALFGIGVLEALLVFVPLCRRSWNWSGAIQAAAVFMLGAFVVLFPWCLRQKIEFNTWSLSTNSGTLLYAMAKGQSGDENGWNAAQELEADAAGLARDDVAGRVHYFNQKFAAAVMADPLGYLQRVGSAFIEHFWFYVPDDAWEIAWMLVVVGMAAGWASIRRQNPLWLLAIPAIWAVLRFDARFIFLLPILGLPAATLIFRRMRWSGIAVLAAMLIGAALMNAMVGNFGVNRGSIIVFWAAHFLLVLPFFLAARGEYRRISERRDAGRPFWVPVASMQLAMLVVGFALIAVRAFTPEQDPVSLADKVAEEVKDDSSMVVADVEMTGYQAVFGPHEDGGHWSRSFESRGYERVIFFPRHVSGPSRGSLLTSCIAPFTGEFPDQGRFLLAGELNRKEETTLDDAKELVEVVSMTPVDETGEPIIDQRILFPRYYHRGSVSVEN